MKKKIIGILVCMLLIATAVLPVAGNMNNNVIENKNGAISRVDEWLMYLHDPERTGYSTSSAPQTNTVKWTFNAPPGSVCDPAVDSSPAIVNGKVYFSTFNNRFFCIDADTGEELWSFYDESFSTCSPAVYDGKVYVASDYDYLYCLDADTGDEIWKFYKGYRFPCSPAVVDGKVYFAHSRSGSGSGDACLYCLDADTGSKLWEYPMGYLQVTSPAVYNGKVYIGSEDHNMYCFDADTGSILWDFDAGWFVISTPAVFDGKLYFGGNALYCLDADNGNKIWKYTMGNRVASSPAVAYNMVYFLAESGGVHCIDAYNGSKIWNCPTGEVLEGLLTPVVADNKVYIGIWSISGIGKLWCLDAYTGDKVWEYIMDTGVLWSCSPSVAYGRVYMGSGQDNKLYCFEDPSTPPIPPTVDAPTDGIINYDYDFKVRTTDPEGEDVKYYIDWGDGTNTSWIGFYSSGKWITVSHAWSEPSTYLVRVRAKDTYGFISEWSEHIIEIIDAPALDIQAIGSGLFKINTVIKNIGTKDAVINWSIILDGGFILLGRETTGSGNIPVDGEITITSKPIIGFGQTTITVNATVPIGFSDTREQKAFALLFFIVVKLGG